MSVRNWIENKVNNTTLFPDGKTGITPAVESSQNPSQPEILTKDQKDFIAARRKFIRDLGLAGVLVATGAAANFALQNHDTNISLPAPTETHLESQTPASTAEAPSFTIEPTKQPEITQEPTQESPVATQEANAISTQMTLGEEKVYTEKMIGFLSYAPDGPITYWTDGQGKRRYLITGGDGNFLTGDKGNSTHLLITDGTKTLEDIMASGEINLQSFKEVYAYDESDEYRKFYAGITSVLQDPEDPDHLLGTVHAENRPTRDESAKFLATFELAESFDGGETWQDKGPFIKGTDPREPGFQDESGAFRVTGAGEPTSIYNEKDGYAYFSWVDWRGDNAHPDQPYLARAKVGTNLALGELEYWTTDGFSTSFDGDKLKTIIPVPEGWVYTALGKFSFNEDTEKYEMAGECDLGFWRAESDNLTDWSTPELFYVFSEHGGKPHAILKRLEKWDSYPTILDESKPNSQIIGNKGKLYHSTGDNNIPHEPAVLDYTIQTK